ncbi:MAG: F0F1 ATP synthase subunit delta [Chthoniobacteraceae bacterium]
MKLSKEARKAAKSLFIGSFTENRLDEGKVRTVVKELADRKPRHFLEILEGYQRYIRLELAKRHAVVESAINLERETRDELRRALKAKYGSDLTTEFNVTPELIGGLRIKIGSDVWDNSVQDRIARLEDELLHA